MTNQNRGILTEADREYLRGERDLSQGAEYNTLRRIRDRTYWAIIDGAILWHHLPAKERNKIFQRWKEADPEEFARFRDGMTAFLAFLYRGFEDAGGDFERIFEKAAQSARREGYDTERLKERLKAGDILRQDELMHLRHQGVDLNKYFEQRASEPGGHVASESPVTSHDEVHRNDVDTDADSSLDPPKSDSWSGRAMTEKLGIEDKSDSDDDDTE